MALAEVARQAGVPVPCIQLIAKWEGCKEPIGGGLYAPYLCPARFPTIGLGTTVYNETGRPVRLTDPPITRSRAEELLAYDIGKKYAPAVRRAAKFKTMNQFGACTSFAYNVGTEGFRRSTLCHLINAGRYDAAQREFSRWVRGGGRVLPGLVNRRRDEAAMFASPGEAYSAPGDAPAVSIVPITNAPATPVRARWWQFWKRG